jgi:hypothetical protein
LVGRKGYYSLLLREYLLENTLDLGFIVLEARLFNLLPPRRFWRKYNYSSDVDPNWHPTPAPLAPPRLAQHPAVVRSTVCWFDLCLQSRVYWFDLCLWSRVWWSGWWLPHWLCSISGDRSPCHPSWPCRSMRRRRLVLVSA